MMGKKYNQDLVGKQSLTPKYHVCLGKNLAYVFDQDGLQYPDPIVKLYGRHYVVGTALQAFDDHSVYKYAFGDPQHFQGVKVNGKLLNLILSQYASVPKFIQDIFKSKTADMKKLCSGTITSTKDYDRLFHSYGSFCDQLLKLSDKAWNDLNLNADTLEVWQAQIIANAMDRECLEVLDIFDHYYNNHNIVIYCDPDYVLSIDWEGFDADVVEHGGFKGSRFYEITEQYFLDEECYDYSHIRQLLHLEEESGDEYSKDLMAEYKACEAQLMEECPAQIPVKEIGKKVESRVVENTASSDSQKPAKSVSGEEENKVVQQQEVGKQQVKLPSVERSAFDSEQSEDEEKIPLAPAVANLQAKVEESKVSLKGVSYPELPSPKPNVEAAPEEQREPTKSSAIVPEQQELQPSQPTETKESKKEDKQEEDVKEEEKKEEEPVPKSVENQAQGNPEPPKKQLQAKRAVKKEEKPATKVEAAQPKEQVVEEEENFDEFLNFYNNIGVVPEQEVIHMLDSPTYQPSCPTIPYEKLKEEKMAKTIEIENRRLLSLFEFFEWPLSQVGVPYLSIGGTKVKPMTFLTGDEFDIMTRVKRKHPFTDYRTSLNYYREQRQLMESMHMPEHLKKESEQWLYAIAKVYAALVLTDGQLTISQFNYLCDCRAPRLDKALLEHLERLRQPKPFLLYRLKRKNSKKEPVKPSSESVREPKEESKETSISLYAMKGKESRPEMLLRPNAELNTGLDRYKAYEKTLEPPMDNKLSFKDEPRMYQGNKPPGQSHTNMAHARRVTIGSVMQMIAEKSKERLQVVIGLGSVIKRDLFRDLNKGCCNILVNPSYVAKDLNGVAPNMRFDADKVKYLLPEEFEALPEDTYFNYGEGVLHLPNGPSKRHQHVIHFDKPFSDDVLLDILSITQTLDVEFDVHVVSIFSAWYIKAAYFLKLARVYANHRPVLHIVGHHFTDAQSQHDMQGLHDETELLQFHGDTILMKVAGGPEYHMHRSESILDYQNYDTILPVIKVPDSDPRQFLAELANNNMGLARTYGKSLACVYDHCYSSATNYVRFKLLDCGLFTKRVVKRVGACPETLTTVTVKNTSGKGVEQMFVTNFLLGRRVCFYDDVNNSISSHTYAIIRGHSGAINQATGQLVDHFVDKHFIPQTEKSIGGAICKYMSQIQGEILKPHYILLEPSTTSRYVQFYVEYEGWTNKVITCNKSLIAHLLNIQAKAGKVNLSSNYFQGHKSNVNEFVIDQGLQVQGAINLLCEVEPKIITPSWYLVVVGLLWVAVFVSSLVNSVLLYYEYEDDLEQAIEFLQDIIDGYHPGLDLKYWWCYFIYPIDALWFALKYTAVQAAHIVLRIYVVYQQFGKTFISYILEAGILAIILAANFKILLKFRAWLNSRVKQPDTIIQLPFWALHAGWQNPFVGDGKRYVAYLETSVKLDHSKALIPRDDIVYRYLMGGFWCCKRDREVPMGNAVIEFEEQENQEDFHNVIKVPAKKKSSVNDEPFVMQDKYHQVRQSLLSGSNHFNQFANRWNSKDLNELAKLLEDRSQRDYALLISGQYMVFDDQLEYHHQSVSRCHIPTTHNNRPQLPKFERVGQMKVYQANARDIDHVYAILESISNQSELTYHQWSDRFIALNNKKCFMITGDIQQWKPLIRYAMAQVSVVSTFDTNWPELRTVVINPQQQYYQLNNITFTDLNEMSNQFGLPNLTELSVFTDLQLTISQIKLIQDFVKAAQSPSTSTTSTAFKIIGGNTIYQLSRQAFGDFFDKLGLSAVKDYFGNHHTLDLSCYFNNQIGAFNQRTDLKSISKNIVDVGSGQTGYECVIQSLYACYQALILKKKVIEISPNPYLAFSKVCFQRGISPPPLSSEGLTMQQVVDWCKANSLSVVFFDTGSSSGTVHEAEYITTGVPVFQLVNHQAHCMIMIDNFPNVHFTYNGRQLLSMKHMVQRSLLYDCPCAVCGIGNHHRHLDSIMESVISDCKPSISCQNCYNFYTDNKRLLPAYATSSYQRDQAIAKDKLTSVENKIDRYISSNKIQHAWQDSCYEWVNNALYAIRGRKPINTGDVDIQIKEKEEGSMIFNSESSKWLLQSTCYGHGDHNFSTNFLKIKRYQPSLCNLRQSITHQVGWIFNLPMQRFRSCDHNTLVTLQGRVACATQLINQDLMDKFHQFQYRWINSNLHFDEQSYCVASEPVISTQQYIDQMKKPAGTIKHYSSLNENFDVSRTVDPTVDLFIKAELTSGTGAMPRAIQPRDDQARNMSGPYYKLLEKQIYAMPEMIKLVPGVERGDYIISRLAGYNHYLELDFSKFDAHQRDCHLDLEDKVVDRILGPNAKYWYQLVSTSGHGKSKTGALAYWNHKSRYSGETTTALTNTLLNILLFKFAQQELGFTGTIVAEGDDSIIALDHDSYVPQLIDLYNQLGMPVTSKVSNQLDGTVFCKRQLRYAGEGKYVSWRQPGQCLFKLGWSLKNRGNLNSKSANKYYASKLSSAIVEYAGIDIMQQLFKVMSSHLELPKSIKDLNETGVVTEDIIRYIEDREDQEKYQLIIPSGDRQALNKLFDSLHEAEIKQLILRIKSAKLTDIIQCADLTSVFDPEDFEDHGKLLKNPRNHAGNLPAVARFVKGPKISEVKERVTAFADEQELVKAK